MHQFHRLVLCIMLETGLVKTHNTWSCAKIVLVAVSARNSL